MSRKTVLDGIATARQFSAKITLRSLLCNKMPITLMATIYKVVHPTTDSMTYEDVCFIACPKLYIWEAIHQLA